MQKAETETLSQRINASGLGTYLQFFNNGLSYIKYKQFKWLLFTISI
jgi:hypothetical protein